MFRNSKVQIILTKILIGGYIVILTEAMYFRKMEDLYFYSCKRGTNDTLGSASRLDDNESTIQGIGVVNCPPVNYAKELEKLNLNVIGVKEFALGTDNKTEEIASKHMVGLNLDFLSMANYRLGHGFVDIIKNLKTLDATNMVIPKLPANHSLINLYLTNCKIENDPGFCGNIESFIFRKWEIPKLTGEWLAGCPKLKELSLIDSKDDKIRVVLSGLKSLLSLSITDSFFSNNIWNGELVKGIDNLSSLNLSQSKIGSITSDAFVHSPKLKILNLFGNQIDISKFTEADPLAKLPQLTSVVLDRNTKFGEMCSSGQTRWRAKIPKISLVDVGLSTLCFRDWEGMLVLDLSKNNIQTLNFTELPGPIKGYLLVDMRNNPIKIPSMSEDDYKLVIKKFAESKKIIIKTDPVKLDCDCQHGWLARIMRSLPFFVNNATCTDGVHLVTLPPEQIECDKYECEPCICRQNFNKTWITAECSSRELRYIPQLKNVTRMLLRYNLIDYLKPIDFPDNLEFADLRNNLLTNVSSEVAEAMFHSPIRRFLLTGNPILCTCNGLPLLTALHNNSLQVEDFDNLTCSNDGRFVKDVELHELCIEDEEQLYATTPLIPIIFAAVSFQIFIVFMCHVHRKNIAVYLYSKGLCLYCFSEKEIHGERDFDAFLSFCHLDDEFVAENILPGIEDYNLCIHYRDWVGGEWIPRQIAESIARSHRTIIILSRNFVNSSWGMLEFRLAHAAMLKEGCRRLVTVVIDDVVTEPTLDAELQTYLLSNTYVKWGDPWFFKKLRYALPRKNDDPDAEDTYGIEMDNLRAASQNYRPRRLAITGNYDRDFSQNTNTCNQLVLVT